MSTLANRSDFLRVFLVILNFGEFAVPAVVPVVSVGWNDSRAYWAKMVSAFHDQFTMFASHNQFTVAASHDQDFQLTINITCKVSVVIRKCLKFYIFFTI